jgi:hypothetical protein
MNNEERNNKPKETTSDKKNQKKATQLLDTQTSKAQLKPQLVSLSSTYLLFLAAVITLGMLASYTGHHRTADFIFYVSIPLICLLPLGLIVYLIIKARHHSQSFLDKLLDSKIFQFSFRHFEWFAYVQYVLCAPLIYRGINNFPRDPKFSLWMITLSLFFIVSAKLSTTEMRLRLRLFSLEMELIDLTHRIESCESTGGKVANKSK